MWAIVTLIFNRLALLACGTLLGCPFLGAQTITNVAVTKTVDEDVNLGNGSARESRSVDAGNVSATATSFIRRFAFMGGQRFMPDSFPFARIYSFRFGFLVDVTIEDPDHNGYYIALQNRLRGFVTVLGPEDLDPTGLENSYLQLGLLTRADPDLLADDPGDADEDPDESNQVQPISGLTVNTGRAQANIETLSTNLHVDNSELATLGPYYGNRTVRFRIDTSSGSHFIFQNDVDLDGSLRFGLESALQQPDPGSPDAVDPFAGLLSAKYPGVDGESPEDHGLFFEVRLLGLPAEKLLDLELTGNNGQIHLSFKTDRGLNYRVRTNDEFPINMWLGPEFSGDDTRHTEIVLAEDPVHLFEVVVTPE